MVEISGLVLGLILTFLQSQYIFCVTVDRLAEKWAPLVWLAPNETYFPLAVEEFLQHVYPADRNGRIISQKELPVGRSSETLYLITKKDINSLKSNTSFLNGRNPTKGIVPAYVTVSQCPNAMRCNRSQPSNIPCTVQDDKKTAIHLTYWMFYPYNEGKEICFFGRIPTPFIFGRCIGKTKTFGNHVGDFERVSIAFGRDLSPKEIFLSVHDIGAYYRYDPIAKIFVYSREISRKGIMQMAEFPPIIRTLGGRPILFAARGSHGLWSAPGDYHYLRIPKLYDRNGYGTPWKTWKDLKVHRVGVSAPPVWMRYLGKWGNPQSNCFLFRRLGICELSDGPSGISRRMNDFNCEEVLT